MSCAKFKLYGCFQTSYKVRFYHMTYIFGFSDLNFDPCVRQLTQSGRTVFANTPCSSFTSFLFSGHVFWSECKHVLLAWGPHITHSLYSCADPTFCPRKNPDVYQRPRKTTLFNLATTSIPHVDTQDRTRDTSVESQCSTI